MAWSHTEMPNGVSCRIEALFRAAPEDSQEAAGSCPEEVGFGSGQGTPCEPEVFSGAGCLVGAWRAQMGSPPLLEVSRETSVVSGDSVTVSATWGADKDAGSWG